MRKLHRVHEHGITNASVLARAGLSPDMQLLSRAQRQVQLLLQDAARDHDLRQAELQQAMVIHSELEQLSLHGTPSMLTPVNAQHVTQLPCPVCGISFDGVRSLHMHIQAKHPDLNVAARIRFNRAEHSLFGLPFCRFCRVRCTDWHSLEKHATQGMCIRLKQGFAENKTLEIIMSEVKTEEQRNPPQPPADHISHTQAAAFLQHEMFTVPLHDVPQHTGSIRQLSETCALCGQRLQQASRVKTHWQKQHAKAWHLVWRDAVSTARNLVAVFSSLCTFCDSTAKQPRQHADKCSAFFRVSAVRRLRELGCLDSSLAGYKAPSMKQHEVAPTYKSFTLEPTPLGQAFAGTALATKSPATVPSLVEHPDCVSASSHGRPGGVIPPMFRTRQAPPISSSEADASSAPPTPIPWTGKLQLRNPHMLCYMNATLISVMHCLVELQHPWSHLQFLHRVCQRAAHESRPLLLSDLPKFAHLCRRWGFRARQEDASEFLLNVLLPAGQFNTLWECKRITPAGPIVADQGGLPIVIPLLEIATDLQTLINFWFSSSEHNAIAYSDGLVVLQLLRFRRGVKLQTPVRLSEQVQLPVYAEGTNTIWQSHRVLAFVVHEGSHVHRGHYRTMLKVGASWMYQDDNKSAEWCPLTAHHRCNAYLIWLARAQPYRTRGDGILEQVLAKWHGR